MTGSTLDGALPPRHPPCLPWTWPGQKLLLPWMLGCLQQVTRSRSLWRFWFSHFSLFVEKFMFRLISPLPPPRGPPLGEEAGSQRPYQRLFFLCDFSG